MDSMLTLWQAVILGIVQGVTEFFPVSSTAHLILAPWLLHFPDPGETFDVALHAGTLLAVLGFFFMTWVRIIGAAFGARIDIHTGRPIAGRELNTQRRLLWYLVLATIPGAVIGYLFDKQIESTWRNPLIIAASLIGVALIMAWADRAPAQNKDFENTSAGEAWWIGCAQAIAVIPGVSRSGATITAGLFSGLTREAATRFSFLMATPIILAAVVFKAHAVHKMGGIPAAMHAPFVAGVATSAIVGLASIALFIQFLKSRTFTLFVWYRIALGILIIGMFVAGFRSF